MTNPRPRGQLDPRVNPDVIMMICTAGHVDHGKTELVKLLTGCNTDRLKEEQERGMTIELGFAPCFLGGNLCVGIVDVPGHEKLVRNMVAGVSGIGLALLVIAADDGVMPQTVEHAQILQLLGVRRGIVALTKSDLVSREQIAEREREIREFLRGTSLEGATVWPVSSKTLDGYDAFYEALVRETTGAAQSRGAGIFRMPIERSFTPKGFGTVATGIPLAGTIRVGDEVELTPGGLRGRVRGIQCFLRNANEGRAGQCLALNVPDLKHEEAARGRILAAPGYFRPASIFHVRITAVPGLVPPLRNAEEVRFHVGTAESHGHVYLLEDKTLAAGASAVATIAIEDPVVAVAGDRFIVRRLTPPCTAGGGVVLAVCHTAHRPMRKLALEQLRRLEAMLAGRDIADPAAIPARVEYTLAVEQPHGMNIEDLARQLQIRADDASAAIAALVAEKKAVVLGKGHAIHAHLHAAMRQEIQAALRAMSKRDDALSANLSELRASRDWPEPVWESVMSDLRTEHVVVARGGKVMLAEAVARLPEKDRVLADRIVELYEETGFLSPRPDELPTKLGADAGAVGRLLDYLYSAGKLVRLSPGVVFDYNTFRKAEELVVETIRKAGMLDSADFKYKIGSSRKYALAILDFLDARRVTLRMGNNRKLAPGYEKNLL